MATFCPYCEEEIEDQIHRRWVGYYPLDFDFECPKCSKELRQPLIFMPTKKITNDLRTLRGLMRTAFEKWALSKGLDLSHYKFNPMFSDEFNYEYIQIQLLWECWQSASQQAVEAEAEKHGICEHMSEGGHFCKHIEDVVQ